MNPTVKEQPPVIPEAIATVPPLRDGDHLTREDFERRYDAMPDLKKAELIEGIVRMPSPVRHTQHSRPHILMGGWLATYMAFTPGVDAGIEGSLRLDMGSEPQPDLFLMIPRSRGGQAAIDAEDYVAGAPELIVEIAASSVEQDLGNKGDVYLRAGVCEYLVWRVPDRAVDWFARRPGGFEPLMPAEEGIYRSERFPGLWLDAPALVEGALAKVLRVLQEGLASTDHAAFVEQLHAAAQHAPESP